MRDIKPNINSSEKRSRWLNGRISGEYSLLDSLRKVVKSSCANAPSVACEILKLWFQKELNSFETLWKTDQEDSNSQVIITTEEDGEEDMKRLRRMLQNLHSSTRNPFGPFNEQNYHYILEEILEITARREPEAFIELIVSITEQVTAWTQSTPRVTFPLDPLYRGYSHEIDAHSYRSTECLLRDSFITACEALQNAPEKLKPFIQRLEALPYISPQTFLASLFRTIPGAFAVEAATFLLGDKRRLWLGFESQIDSALLLQSIFPLLDISMRNRIEEAIEGLASIDDLTDTQLLRYHRIGQLRLLSSLDRSLLSPPLATLLDELIQEYHGMEGYVPQEAKNITCLIHTAFAVDSPPATAMALSDDDWVRVAEWRTSLSERSNPVNQPQQGHQEDEPTEEEKSTKIAGDETENTLNLEEQAVSDDYYIAAIENLKPTITAEPERFLNIALSRLSSDTDVSLACAFIEGLSHSSLPSERVFEVIIRFESATNCSMQRFWQSVREVVESRGQNGVPDKIIDMLERYIRLDADPNEEITHSARRSPAPSQPRRRINRRDPWAPPIEVPLAPDAEAEDEFDESTWLNMGPYVDYLNWWPQRDIWSALIFALEANERASSSSVVAAENYQKRRWKLIEDTTKNKKEVVRCAGLLALQSLFNIDRTRAFTLYETLVKGYPNLLAMYHSVEILRHAILWFYERALPYINELVHADRAALAQRGAMLATVAAWHNNDRDRPSQLIQGRPAWRRGVGQVWADRAFISHDSSEKRQWCREGLISLLSDSDPFVQIRHSRVLRRLKANDWRIWKPFLEGVLDSPALPECFDALANYLWQYGKSQRSTVLSIIEKICEHPQSRELGLHGFGGEELVRCVLNVYNSALASGSEKKKCIYLFGRLLKQFPGDGNRALQEWDENHFTWG